MIYYYIETKNVKNIKYNDRLIPYNESINFLTKLLNLNFNDLSTYKKYIKKHLSLKNNTPIYINKDVLLFKIRTSKYIMYINYYAISIINTTKYKTTIIFKDETIFNLKVDKNKLVTVLNKIELIEKYFINIKDNPLNI
ncbi:MAG: hypothetical protein ACRC5M_03090 [Anaeroplasmataceae bacterium]